eukprot:4847260-Amphidinium_carterae.1
MTFRTDMRIISASFGPWRSNKTVCGLHSATALVQWTDGLTSGCGNSNHAKCASTRISPLSSC